LGVLNEKRCKEVPCPRLDIFDENKNIKNIPTLKNLALKEVLIHPEILTSDIKNLPIGSNLDPPVNYRNNSPRGGKKYIKKSRKSRKIRKSKKIRKSRKSRKSKY